MVSGVNIPSPKVVQLIPPALAILPDKSTCALFAQTEVSSPASAKGAGTISIVSVYVAAAQPPEATISLVTA